MVYLENILEFLRTRFPEELQESWDNSGLAVGDEAQTVNKVLTALDVTCDTICEAKQLGAELIISHHPLIFKPLKRITEDAGTGTMLRELIKSDIAVYCMHTSFDKAQGGMNDLLAERLGLCGIREYYPEELIAPDGSRTESFGRVGTLASPASFDDFADFVKVTLGCSAIKLFGNGEETVKTVALCTGSGGSMLYAAYNSGADVYLTADLGHHHAQTAAELGLNLIDAGHFETENIITDFLSETLNREFPDLLVKKSNAVPFYRSI